MLGRHSIADKLLPAVIGGAQRRWRRKLPDVVVEQARTAVLVGGLPESAARAAERRGTVDWRPLAAALDSLYVAKGGGLGVKRFLLSPNDSLRGKAPVYVIERERDGVESVAMAAYQESAMVELSRLH